MTTAIDPSTALKAVETLRFLAVDAVEKAKSGHPGLPMGAADFAFVLWSRYLRFDPTAPDWMDRDRFVLSAGHGSMLLYGLLHLAGFDLPLSELQAFRQWGSRTPGHPEFGHTVGVEATTGPLGQGVGNAVGMAIAGKMLAARFNGEDFAPVSHRVFALASDGDLMEGVSGEASSLAGHLKLGNLVVLYDDNRITIEGATGLAWSEDVGRRYEAYGWHVQHADGHDHPSVARAIDAAVAERSRPSLILLRTVIAKGSPNKEGSHHAHGAPLGPEEARASKERLGWPLEPSFHVPDAVRELFREVAARGRALRIDWERRFAAWRLEHPDLALKWDAIVGKTSPADLTSQLLRAASTGPAATREHSAAVLQQIAERVPSLVGGSADLAPSTLTTIRSSSSIAPDDFSGRNLHFGIREHAMGAVLNGMVFYGAFRPFGSTFLVFCDYMRPSIRIAAMSGLPVIYVFTHDSIFVGEDGPTHQPIEQVASLRLIPGLDVFRPADGPETALAWGLALERKDGPSALVLTRQKVPTLERTAHGPLADLRRCGYLVSGTTRPDAILVATGSEVHLAAAAAAALAAEGKRLNVVSIPCLERFERQETAYREALLPKGVPVAALEAGRTLPWRALGGPDALTVGVDTFGASAPAPVLAAKFGFTEEAVTTRIRAWLKAL